MKTTKRFGWIRDLPDQRDRKFLTTRLLSRAPLLPFSVNLRPNAGPIYDQGNLGSCTAQAIAAAIVYEENKQKLPEIFPSRLFIYYNERVIEGSVSSDSGAQIRDGIKSVVNRGVCPETEFGYEHAFDDRPWNSCYVHAKMDLVKAVFEPGPRPEPDANLSRGRLSDHRRIHRIRLVSVGRGSELRPCADAGTG